MPKTKADAQREDFTQTLLLSTPLHDQNVSLELRTVYSTLKAVSIKYKSYHPDIKQVMTSASYIETKRLMSDQVKTIVLVTVALLFVFSFHRGLQREKHLYLS